MKELPQMSDSTISMGHFKFFIKTGGGKITLKRLLLHRVKKLLIISYYWPPAGGPGVQRWVKLSKYLSQLGYQCHVVTVDESKGSYPSIDPSLQKDVAPSIRVTKTASFEALKIFSSLFKKEKVPYAGIPDKNKMSLVGRLALYVRSNFFIPDARMGWNKYALEACLKIIEEEKIDALITTSPPHSTQLIGLVLKKKFPQLKWLADLRDPWTDIYYYDKLSHTENSKKKDQALEKQVLENADAISTVSADIKRLFSAKSEKVPASKITVLPNGFDEEDFTPGITTPNKIFTIAHTGTINSNYTISGFAAALREFSKKHEVAMRLVGNVDPVIKQQFEKELGALVSFIPYVPHSEITREMQGADVLFLAIPDNPRNKGILTGKLFEYLASEKPILAIGPADGDAAVIINECGAGKMFEFNDREKMLAYLEEKHAAWSESRATRLSGAIYKKYSRRELAKQVAQLIDKL
jgi:glycosyltransferase involved in cell wall biosynthesis